MATVWIEIEARLLQRFKRDVCKQGHFKTSYKMSLMQRSIRACSMYACLTQIVHLFPKSLIWFVFGVSSKQCGAWIKIGARLLSRFKRHVFAKRHSHVCLHCIVRNCSFISKDLFLCFGVILLGSRLELNCYEDLKAILFSKSIRAHNACMFTLG